MAEQQQQQAPAAAGSRTASALDELMQGAKALQAVQQAAAQEAMKLPNPRLDEAQEGHAYLRDNGDGTFTAIDAWGNEVKDQSAAKAAEADAAKK